MGLCSLCACHPPADISYLDLPDGQMTDNKRKRNEDSIVLGGRERENKNDCVYVVVCALLFFGNCFKCTFSQKKIKK